MERRERFARLRYREQRRRTLYIRPPVETLNSPKLTTGALAARWLFMLAMAFTIVWSFEVPELPAFQQPELARIFFWHFPCPIIASILLAIGAYHSWRYLRTSDLTWD